MNNKIEEIMTRINDLTRGGCEYHIDFEQDCVVWTVFCNNKHIHINMPRETIQALEIKSCCKVITDKTLEGAFEWN